MAWSAQKSRESVGGSMGFGFDKGREVWGKREE